MHTPVFLKEVIEALEIAEGKRYIDATYGEGGHASEIIKRGGTVLAIDFDEEVTRNKIQETNLKLVWGNFADIEKIAQDNKFYSVDGILFDLGLSMDQIARSGRGFSFLKREEPLDMRISLKVKSTAADIINSFSAGKLYEIFAKNSEEIDSRAIAETIVRARHIKEIKTVGQLINIIDSSRASTSRLRRIFQALRIEVNDEFENLKRGLAGALKILEKRGRIVVLTYHSLEDRIVKNFARENNFALVKKQPKFITRRKFERSARIRILR